MNEHVYVDVRIERNKNENRKVEVVWKKKSKFEINNPDLLF